MDDGVKSFQRDYGLKTDGVLKPSGETERSLFETVTGRAFGQQEGQKSGGSVGFGGNVSGVLAMNKTAEADSKEKSEKEVPHTPNSRSEPSKDEEKLSGCIDKEIAWINAQGAYQVAKDNIRKAKEELKSHKASLEQLKMLLKKETSYIDGDKGKARYIGGTIGAGVGGALGGLPGAAIGLGLGGNIAPFIEEGADFVTGQETDYEIRVNIKTIKNDITKLESEIENTLVPQMDEVRERLRTAKRLYFDCKKKK
jgi:hypothetical protein